MFEELGCPRIGGSCFDRFDPCPRCPARVILALKRNSQVSVSIMPLRIDFDGAAAVVLCVGVTAKRIETTSGVVEEEIRRAGLVGRKRQPHAVMLQSHCP